MTAAEASIVVQEQETDKKATQNSDASEERKPVTGAESGDTKAVSGDKVGEPVKDSAQTEKDVAKPSTEDRDDAEAKTNDSAGEKTESSKTDGPASEETAEKSNEVENDTKTATKDRSVDPAVEARQCLVQGKRSMLVQDYAMAVEFAQRACELLAAKYGDDASECAEALLYYGKALLELHRRESTALNEIDNQEATEDDDSSDEEKDEEDDKEKKTEDEESGDEKKTDEDAGDQTAKDEEDLEGEPDPNNEAKEAQQAVDVNEDDDVTNLQIAFEVLELAKKIYKRDAEKDAQLYLKAADCLLSLGEINLESDTYDRAIDDFEACLRIQQEMLPRDARALAETNYQLGLTYSFVNKYEQSAAYFGDALQILELKVSNLKKTIEDEKAKDSKASASEEDVVKNCEEEINEIQQLLPEIVAKIHDAEEMQKDNAQGDKEKIISELMNREPEVSPMKKETKVNVISSSLIKRKRPADEADTAALSSGDQAEKKLKEN